MRNDELTDLLRQLAADYFNPISVCYHYLSIARNKLDEVLETKESKIKKYFYILRPLANLRFTFENLKAPLMNYFETLSKLCISDEIKSEIDNLYRLKLVSDEGFMIAQNTQLIEYFKSEISFFESSLKDMKFAKNKDYDKADIIFREILNKA